MALQEEKVEGEIVEDGVLLYYRSTQNENEYFGTKLYQWSVGEKYITRDCPNLVVPVSYETYVKTSKFVENFTVEDKNSYMYLDILKQDDAIANTVNYYFIDGARGVSH